MRPKLFVWMCICTYTSIRIRTVALIPLPLSLEDAREIADNMIGLFSFLLELEQKYSKEEKKI